ncbi:hypothetical protein D7Y41_32160 [Anaerotruncus sp. 1XD22-93]|nr:hypothetical protein [Lachnospiraceae bacterium]NBI76947.1 hypothetical protein [Lachnospiraceae bacterium]RKJ76227.1 hypothetical protein D7Y41_32160 [Anaerotruncus sp. 1XD22-93]
MRLIDADKIDFGKVFIGASDFAKDTREAAQKLIDEQPTAYDVDKVVEQLEKESQNIELIYPTDQGYDYEDAIGIDINKAKQIVKSGGIE